jgi:hypothetical protein
MSGIVKLGYLSDRSGDSAIKLYLLLRKLTNSLADSSHTPQQYTLFNLASSHLHIYYYTRHRPEQTDDLKQAS